MNIRHFRELRVYQLSRDIALEVFEISKNFPIEEKYSLTDQIRRSSRSVCANLAEAWRKRIYVAAFKAKLSDCEAECAETQVWLEFAHVFKYLCDETYKSLDSKCEHVASMLIKMRDNSSDWQITRTTNTAE